jgi:hypothetical protein
MRPGIGAGPRKANCLNEAWDTVLSLEGLLRPELNSLRALAPLVRLGFKRDAHALGQVLQSRLLKGCDVDKDVVAAAIRLDEAEPLLFVEKFHCPSLTHRFATDLSAFSMLGTVLPRKMTCGAMSYATKVFYLAQGANDTAADYFRSCQA